MASASTAIRTCVLVSSGRCKLHMSMKKPLLRQGIPYRQHLSAVMGHRHASLFLLHVGALRSLLTHGPG